LAGTDDEASKKKVEIRKRQKILTERAALNRSNDELKIDGQEQAFAGRPILMQHYH
jgi:hypothetical protein